MLFFQNPGVMPPAAFMVFGNHTKPNTDTPFGRFGTGLKNAIAVILREGGSIAIQTKESNVRLDYVFSISEELFRGEPIQLIVCTVTSTAYLKNAPDLVETSTIDVPFTTDLGKDWELWMAERELASNADDEGGDFCGIFDSLEDFGPIEDNQTVIQVTCPQMEKEISARKGAFNTVIPKDAEVFLHGAERFVVYDRHSHFIYSQGLAIAKLQHPSAVTYEYVEAPWGLTDDRLIKVTAGTLLSFVDILLTEAVHNEDIQDLLGVLNHNEGYWETVCEPPSSLQVITQAQAGIIRKLNRTPLLSALLAEYESRRKRQTESELMMYVGLPKTFAPKLAEILIADGSADSLTLAGTIKRNLGLVVTEPDEDVPF